MEDSGDIYLLTVHRSNQGSTTITKRKKHDFFLLHFRFVNFISHQMITLNVFFNIFFVHNAHTIDFKIYNIHNFSLNQSRVFFFFSGYTTARLHGEHSLLAGSPPVPAKREFFFFYFYKTKNTHTQKHTPQRPTQRRNSKNLLQRSLTPSLPRPGDDVPTQTASLLLLSGELCHRS